MTKAETTPATTAEAAGRRRPEPRPVKKAAPAKKAAAPKRAPRKVTPVEGALLAQSDPQASGQPTAADTPAVEITTPGAASAHTAGQAPTRENAPQQQTPTAEATAKAPAAETSAQAPTATTEAALDGEPLRPSTETAAHPATPTTAITRPAAGPVHPEPDPWAALLTDPGHAPETLARAAVEIIGPRAQAWVAHTRAAYPAATNTALAGLAARQFVRFGGLAGLFGSVAGSYAPVALLSGTALTHAQLVLHVAAAYGIDPTHPDRVAELLTIARMDDRSWHLARVLAVQTAAWAAVRLVNRRLPGTSVLTAVLAGTTTARSTAARADAFYRKLTAAG